MAKIVRLTGAEQRKWTRNSQVILSGDGSPLREVTENEQRAIVELTRHMRVKRTSASARSPGESSTVAVHVETDERGRPTAARFTIDGMELTDTRSVMRSELLQKHGECQLRWTNGKVMTTIRDPRITRPTAKDALRSSTAPNNCVCKDWGDPHPGRHHRVCQENQKAPPEERGDLGMDGGPVHVSEAEVEILEAGSISHGSREDAGQAPFGQKKTGQRLLSTGATVGTVESAPVVVTPPAAYAPADCPNSCASWVRHDGKTEGHHPICKYADAWAAASRPPMVLVDIDSGEVLRDAKIDEIGEAEASEKRTGAATVKIGDQLFLVMPRSDAGEPPEEAKLNELEGKPVNPPKAPPGEVKIEEA